MKKTLIAISVACVAALASMAEEDTAGSGAYESLKFATNTWFTVTKGETSPDVVGGAITGDLTQGEDEYLGFDTTESGAPVVFTADADNERTNDITTVTFDVKAATVPNGKLAAVSAATNAVCLYESETDPAATNFYVKVSGGTGWVQMGSTKVPFEGEAYKLVVRFDNRASGRKVQFAAIVAGEEVVLTNATVTDGWLTYTEEVEERINVGLLGKGALKALRGDQLVIIAEVIVTPGGKVEVDEKVLTVFEAECAEKGIPVATYLNNNAQDTYKDKNTNIDPGLTVAQAYALGLVKSDNNGGLEFPNNGELDVKAEAAEVDSYGNIKVGFVDVTPNVKSGASFSYQLMRSLTGTKDTWEPSEEGPVDDLDDVKIPGTDVTAGYHYFKVVTTVTLKDAPPETQVEEQN